MKKLLLTLAFILTVTSALAADQWRNQTASNTSTPVGTTFINDIDTSITSYIVNPLERLNSKYRQGMKLTYVSESTLSVGAGEVVCSNNAGTIRQMRANTSSTNITFSDIDTGAEASGTTYYVYAICDADAETATFKISTSSSSAPSGTTYFARLGYFYNNSNSDISAIRNDRMLSFSSRVSKSGSVVYQALTDGTVTAYVAAGASGLIYGDVGPTSSLGTRIAYQEAPSGGSASGVYLAITFPVLAGEYYKVLGNAGAPTIYFTPLE